MHICAYVFNGISIWIISEEERIEWGSILSGCIQEMLLSYHYSVGPYFIIFYVCCRAVQCCVVLLVRVIQAAWIFRRNRYIIILIESFFSFQQSIIFFISLMWYVVYVIFKSLGRNHISDQCKTWSIKKCYWYFIPGKAIFYNSCYKTLNSRSYMKKYMNRKNKNVEARCYNDSKTSLLKVRKNDEPFFIAILKSEIYYKIVLFLCIYFLWVILFKGAENVP